MLIESVVVFENCVEMVETDESCMEILWILIRKVYGLRFHNREKSECDKCKLMVDSWKESDDPMASALHNVLDSLLHALSSPSVTPQNVFGFAIRSGKSSALASPCRMTGIQY